MLAVRDLSFEYSDIPLLENVNFTLLPGQILHLQGGNGKGKTTLLRIIAGLLQPDSGTVSLNDIVNTNREERYSQQLCMLGHTTGLNDLLSLRENYRTMEGVNTTVLEEKIQSANLEQFSDQWVGLLSAGQKRRAALLRLELEAKSLWLLDEPFVALDKNAMIYLTDLMVSHLKNNGMIVMTSHQALPSELYPCQEYHL